MKTLTRYVAPRVEASPAGQPQSAQPRVVVAHDYVTQRGGAERVALAMLRCFPGSPLVTSVYAAERTFPGFDRHQVRTSLLQNVPAFRNDPRLALPLLAPAWGMTTIDDADVVVASSSGWAHAVRTAPGVRKVVYCHNPARWLYQSEEYFARSPWRGAALAPVRRPLARWDNRAARTADRYLANSTVVAERIKRVYGIEAEVLAPPVAVDVDAEREPVPGLEPGFLITVARGRGYKNTAIVEDAVAGMAGQRLVVVGSGSGDPRTAPAPVTRLGIVSDAQLRWLYANARALVSVSYEDFGLTPIEANAFGTPAVVLRAGGFLDTLDPGVSGVFVEEPTVQAVRDALRRLPDLDRARVAQHAGRYSESAFRTRLRAVVRDVVAGPRVIKLPEQERTIDLRDPEAARIG
ncbi:glycosyltransferase family 4 protein [Motilibacter sp. E257]|uniref:Glycosyltransferase family 4 protein n=2 Tax=Motilibacter deserti TaxID=2714956 RepID=A0ABX0GU47_9ACTN|nr:glycosyltransferase [Motilibacter deserti]NHC14396.1 glycosyltransferase family 4 protein [Motilibacter deserti]